MFEYTEEQIIQAHFDYQKQYDLLRIYQRIDNISTAIVNASEHILILSNIKGKLPVELHEQTKDLLSLIISEHSLFKQALEQYENDKSDVIGTIHRVIECDQSVNEVCNICIEKLYLAANRNELSLGTFRAIEHIYSNLQFLGTKIEKAATSLEWLLIS